MGARKILEEISLSGMVISPRTLPYKWEEASFTPSSVVFASSVVFEVSSGFLLRMKTRHPTRSVPAAEIW
jgi:hypothetical protein